jgi:hypothetical protein
MFQVSYRGCANKRRRVGRLPKRHEMPLDTKLAASFSYEVDPLAKCNLSGLSVGPNGTAALAAELQKNARLNELVLAGNNIGDEGVHAVSGIL